MIAGRLFNAIAFVGAGYLFNRLNNGDYVEEIRRHNLALENLTRAKKLYENEVRQKDDIIAWRQMLDAKLDIEKAKQALAELKEL